MPKIIVVEDDPTLLDTLEYNLEKQGYTVVTADNGLTALDLIREHEPDLIVLDVMLPGLDGLEICRIIRREMNMPILMLTAKGNELDKVVGLEVGADDYLTKPFSMRELLARVKAHLRLVRLIREEVAHDAPANDAPAHDRLVANNLIIDLDRREATLNGKPLRLKPKEYDLLVFLVRNKGVALSRDLILERVWGWFNDNSRTVDVHVRWLREKIEVDSSNAKRLVTVRGIGYRFEG